jgi:hypothetical protein
MSKKLVLKGELIVLCDEGETAGLVLDEAFVEDKVLEAVQPDFAMDGDLSLGAVIITIEFQEA